MEMVVFTSQLLGIASFIIVCKIFIAVKRYLCTEEEIEAIKHGEDAFWRNLFTNEESLSDFLEHESYVMGSITLMFCNLYVMIAATIFVFEEINQVKEYKVGFRLSMLADCVVLLVFLSMVWCGASFEKLFRRTNLLIMMGLMLLTVILTVFSLVYGQVLLPKTVNSMSRYFKFF